MRLSNKYFTLPFHYRKIIYNEFYLKNKDKEWWKEFYTPKQYKAFRKQAFEMFLD